MPDMYFLSNISRTFNDECMCLRQSLPRMLSSVTNATLAQRLDPIRSVYDYQVQHSVYI